MMMDSIIASYGKLKLMQVCIDCCNNVIIKIYIYLYLKK